MSLSIPIDLDKLKDGIAELTSYTYKKRIERILKETGKPIQWVMQHPRETIKIINTTGYTQNNGTLAACAVAICKLFKVHPQSMTNWSRSYLVWQKYITIFRKREEELVAQSKMTEKQQDKVLDWDSVKAKYCELEKLPTRDTNFQTHMEYILFAILMNIKPKRSDLGTVEIIQYKSVNSQTEPNYIELSPTKAALTLRQYKTFKTHGKLREEFPKQLVTILNNSLSKFPRKYLFITPRTKQPYNNNAYSHFVRRTFDKYLRKAMGVSLWRHVYVRANIDFNNMSTQDMESSARLLGHSLDQMFKRYRKIDIEPRADHLKGKPETCEN